MNVSLDIDAKVACFEESRGTCWQRFGSSQRHLTFSSSVMTRAAILAASLCFQCFRQPTAVRDSSRITAHLSSVSSRCTHGHTAPTTHDTAIFHRLPSSTLPLRHPLPTQPSKPPTNTATRAPKTEFRRWQRHQAQSDLLQFYHFW